jgi:hypothetical protein
MSKHLKLSELAKVCGVKVDTIKTIIKKERIKPLQTSPQTLDNVQQSIIARILFFEGKTEWLIFESKMNQSNLV